VQTVKANGPMEFVLDQRSATAPLIALLGQWFDWAAGVMIAPALRRDQGWPMLLAAGGTRLEGGALSTLFPRLVGAAATAAGRTLPVVGVDLSLNRFRHEFVTHHIGRGAGDNFIAGAARFMGNR
jgi:hypothetical protein